MPYALDFTVNHRVYVIYPAVSHSFGQFHWSRAKTGYSVTDIRPCKYVWDRVHCQGCLIGRIWPCLWIIYYLFPLFSLSTYVRFQNRVQYNRSTSFSCSLGSYIMSCLPDTIMNDHISAFCCRFMAFITFLQPETAPGKATYVGS